MGFKIQFSSVILALTVLFAFSGCSENLFDRAADKETQEAIIFEANQLLNKRDFDGAIVLFNSLDPASLADREVAVLFASAYSGRCGLEFITLVEDLSDASSSSVFGLLMAGFPEATLLKSADCDEAETRLKAIGDESVRNIDENLLATFNAFAEIGTTLSAVADTDDDGITDPGFDQCNSTDLPDAQVDQVGAALALVVKSLAAIGGDFADIDDINDACTNPLFSDICEKDNGGFNTNELRALRAFIGSDDLGIASCGPFGDISCLCP